jgi:hypothetical protein
MTQVAITIDVEPVHIRFGAAPSSLPLFHGAFPMVFAIALLAHLIESDLFT